MRPRQARDMSEVEAAWVGAMIDAEGWIVRATAHRVNALRICLGNTAPEIISGLLRATGVGTVCCRAFKPKHYLPYFQWSVNAWNDVMAIAKQCAPYSVKAQDVLSYTRRITT